MQDVRVEVRRGGVVESAHRVSVAVVVDGRVRASAGNPELVTFARSAIKPIQAIPLIDDGVADRFALTGEELALCCASHSGEPAHVAGVLGLLDRIGSSPSDLACGPHPPLGQAAAKALHDAGQAPERVHNNCSGKHAGMLALARTHDWPLTGYQMADHPVQRRMMREVESWTGCALGARDTAVDGCGVVTFALTLHAMADAFARLARAANQPDSAAARVLSAMAGHPVLVAGLDRLCTRLMQAVGGRIVVKVGAEGVYCAAVPAAGVGMALKVEDGALRAAEPALIGVLRALGFMSDDEAAALGDVVEPPVHNTRGDRVGSLVSVVRLERHA